MEKIPEFYAVITDTNEFDKWFAIRPYPDGFNYNGTVLPEGLLRFIALKPGETCGRYYYPARITPVIELAEMLRIEELTRGGLIGYVSPVRMFIHEFNKQHPEYMLYVPALPTKESKAYVQRIPSSTTEENKSMTQDTNYDNYYAAIADTSKFIEAYGAWSIGDPVNLSDAGVQFIHTRKAEDMNRLRGLPALKVTEIASVFFAESHSSGSVDNFFGELFSDYAPGKSIAFGGREQGKFTPEIVNSADLKIYDPVTGTYKTLAEVSKYVPVPTVVPGVIKMTRKVMAFRALVALKTAYPATRGEPISLPFTHADGTIDLLGLAKYRSGSHDLLKTSLKQPEHQKVSLSEVKVFLDSVAGKTPAAASELTEEQKQESIDLAVSILLKNMMPIHQLLDNETASNDNPLVCCRCSESGNAVSSRHYFIDCQPMFTFVKNLYAEEYKDDLPKDANGKTPDIQMPSGSVLRRRSVFDRYSHAGNVLSKVLPAHMTEILAVCDDIKLKADGIAVHESGITEVGLKLHAHGTAEPRMMMHGNPADKCKHSTELGEASLGLPSFLLERIWEAVENASPNKVVVSTKLNLSKPEPVKEEPVPESDIDIVEPIFPKEIGDYPNTMLLVGFHFEKGITYDIENNWEFTKENIDAVKFVNLEGDAEFNTPRLMAEYVNILNANLKTGWVFKPASDILSGLLPECYAERNLSTQMKLGGLFELLVTQFNKDFGYSRIDHSY